MSVDLLDKRYSALNTWFLEKLDKTEWLSQMSFADQPGFKAALGADFIMMYLFAVADGFSREDAREWAWKRTATVLEKA